MKLTETIGLLFIMGIIAVTGNAVGYNLPVLDAVIGYLILMAITLIGMLLKRLIPINVPTVFWISIIGVLFTCPWCPYSGVFNQYIKKVDFLSLCTPILAYAGISVGKDMAMFKKMSWRIVVVSLLVFTGTFIFSAIIAQTVLHLEGVI